MDYNSTKNQEIKAKLVQRNIIHVASTMISELSSNDQFADEIMEKFYSVPDCEGAVEDYLYDITEEEQRELLEEYEVDSPEDLDSEQVCNDKDLEYGYLEPLEFWIVDDYFGDKLKEKGQIVDDFLGFTIWGRQTSGQAILLDYVIGSIAEDMEILEGQSNSWE